MPDFTVDQLKVLFENMQGSIGTTINTLKNLQPGTVIIDRNPARCLPFNINNQLFDGCDVPVHVLHEPVTVEIALQTVTIMDKWLKDIIDVLRGADPTLPLP